MPGKNNPTSATLNIRDSASKETGWTDVKASNGAIYSYQYTGGNQPANNGSILNTVGGGHAATTLRLANTDDARYEFASISFTGDNAEQLSTDAAQLTPEGNASQTRVIKDKCTAVIEAHYHVQVLDTKVNATIPCDPMIKNQ